MNPIQHNIRLDLKRHVRHTLLGGCIVMAGVLALGSALAQGVPTLPATSAAPADPYLYMEDLQDANASRWADAQTSQTLDAVRKMPGFDERYRANLKALSDRELNIQYPASEAGFIYNHYRAANQPKGVWRRTTLEEYRKPRPNWQTLINLDSHNRNEPVDWTWSGATVQPAVLQDLAQRPVRALIRLSPKCCLNRATASPRRVTPSPPSIWWSMSCAICKAAWWFTT